MHQRHHHLDHHYPIPLILLRHHQLPLKLEILDKRKIYKHHYHRKIKD
jgi:hypothetical protein